MNLTLEELSLMLSPYRRDLGPFRLSFGPYATPGDGAYRGLRHMDLIEAYAEGLEQARSKFADLFAGRRPADVPTLVFHLPDYKYAKGGAPFTVPGPTGAVIGLSNRSSMRCSDGRASLAQCTAVHEASHAYQLAIRPNDPKRRDWTWFMEATSVFCEGFVFPRNKAATEFYKNWLDDPEIPLDYSSYESGMFARWLSRRFSPQLIGDIWTRSGQEDTPFQMIERLAAPIESLFAAYARDAYFIADPASGCYLPGLAKWWGLRETRHQVKLPDQSGVSVESVLDHLAVHYVRIDVSESVRAVTCVMEDGPGLEAQLAEYQPGGRRGESAGLQPAGRVGATAPLRANHFVVTISNSSRTTNRVRYKLSVASE